MVGGGNLGQFGKSILGNFVHLGKSISWTPHQNTDSHPCNRPPSSGTRGNKGDTTEFVLVPPKMNIKKSGAPYFPKGSKMWISKMSRYEY